MSLLPIFANDAWDDFRGPVQLFDQHFGSGMNMNDLLQPFRSYYRPWRHFPPRHSGISRVHLDKDGFSVSIDVRHFSPEEITVKQVDNHVVVEGKHDETPDEHGYVSRHFIRRYILPKSVNADALSSNLSSDGVLTITAPRVLEVEGKKVRAIPIQQTGAPAVKQQENAPSQSVITEKPAAK